MESLIGLKTKVDDFEVEFEILPPVDLSTETDERKLQILKELQSVDEQLQQCNARVDILNKQIDRLTNHADGLDYIIAVASGILTGLIDSVFVEEMDIKSSTEEAEKKIAEKVKEKALKEKQDDTVKKAIEGAKKKGRKLSKEEIEEIKKRVRTEFYSNPNNVPETGKDPVLKRAIKYLEENHPIPQDNLFHGAGSSPANHHLDDIAHHASLIGMIASIVVQFFRVATFVNNEGKWTIKFVKTDPEELMELWLPIVISGLLNWLVHIAEKNISEEEKEKIPEPVFKLAHLLASAPAIIQVVKAIDNWCLHLYSDVAGSSSSKGRGAGIPGLFVSLLKELSCVPPLNLTGLPKVVDYLYVTQKVDLRTEIGIAEELGRQAVPVIINEVLVRTFYFVRHLINEYKKENSFEGIDWEKVIPFGNRTVERMMTIASGTFTAVDMADAAIRSGVKSGGNSAQFLKNFVLSVNFVGVGRFAIACVTDAKMGVERSKLRNERIAVMSQQLTLMNAKVYYKCAQVYIAQSELAEQQESMWLSAVDTAKTIEEAYDYMQFKMVSYQEDLVAIQENLEKISEHIDLMSKYHPDVRKTMLDKIRFGEN